MNILFKTLRKSYLFLFGEIGDSFKRREKTEVALGVALCAVAPFVIIVFIFWFIVFPRKWFKVGELVYDFRRDQFCIVLSDLGFDQIASNMPEIPDDSPFSYTVFNQNLMHEEIVSNRHLNKV